MSIHAATLDRAVRWGLRGAAVLALSIAGFGVSAPAGATPIGPSCGSCDGAIYDLSFSGLPISSDATYATYEFTLSIDTNTYNPGGSFSPPYYLANVAIKVADDVQAASLVNATPGGTSNWSSVALNNGLNSNGCSNGGSGFICVDGLDNGGKGTLVTTGNGVGYDYTFVFDITLLKTDTFLDPATIKARYVDDNDDKVGNLLSEDIHISIKTPPQHDIPEPMSLLLLGLGLGALGLTRRRRPC